MSKLAFILVIQLLAGRLAGQSSAGYEQYNYLGQNRRNTVVPMIHFRDLKAWYAELRYNYEERETWSLNGGKQFSFGRELTMDLTPMVGMVFGLLSGASLGCNTELNYRHFFFSSQMQYTYAMPNRALSYLFNWSEAGIKPLSWLYAGVSIQHTQVYRTGALLEKGVMIGFVNRNFSFPVYYFSPFTAKQYWVAGILWEWKQKK